MKKIICLFLTAVLMCCMLTPAAAYEQMQQSDEVDGLFTMRSIFYKYGTDGSNSFNSTGLSSYTLTLKDEYVSLDENLLITLLPNFEKDEPDIYEFTVNEVELLPIEGVDGVKTALLFDTPYFCLDAKSYKFTIEAGSLVRPDSSTNDTICYTCTKDEIAGNFSTGVEIMSRAYEVVGKKTDVKVEISCNYCIEESNIPTVNALTDYYNNALTIESSDESVMTTNGKDSFRIVGVGNADLIIRLSDNISTYLPLHTETIFSFGGDVLLEFLLIPFGLSLMSLVPLFIILFPLLSLLV